MQLNKGPLCDLESRNCFASNLKSLLIVTVRLSQLEKPRGRFQQGISLFCRFSANSAHLANILGFSI